MMLGRHIFFKHEVVILSFRCNFSTEFQSEEGRTIGIVNKINETTVTKNPLIKTLRLGRELI